MQLSKRLGKAVEILDIVSVFRKTCYIVIKDRRLNLYMDISAAGW